MKSKVNKLVFGSLIVVSVFGCGGQVSDADVSAMPTVIALKNEVAILTQRLDDNDSVTRATKSDVANLENDLSASSTRVNDIDARVTLLESNPVSTNSNSTLVIRESLSDEEYKIRYSQALDGFKAREYDKAISEFQILVESNPDSDLADNAQFWLGECYYGKKEYDRAILEFEKVFTFPSNNKMDDAQIKLGLCYLKLSNTTSAKKEFNRLVEFYPDSEYRSLADRYLKNL